MTLLFSKFLGVVLLFSIALPDCSFADERPNLLFIIVDDQSPFDLKIYNPDSKLDTPVIDKIAREGMVFDRAYHMGAWSGAVCTPSRHMVMSGRTVWHLPRNRRRKGKGSVTEELTAPELANTSMAAVFNQAGYETVRTCKKGNSFEAANAKFKIRNDSTKRGGTDESGSAWHAEQVLQYLSQREDSKRSGSISDLLWLLSSS